jgi:diguanylate cyclase
VDFLDDLDHALQFSGDAMRLMSQYRVPPTPQNFAVWYCFVSGRDPALCKTLDLLIAKGERFTDFQNAAIFERFFGYLKEAATVEETGENMTRILSRVDSLVQQASNDTERYQTTLSDKTATLTNNESSTFVETVSRLITDETQKILSEQKLLQTRLSDSARQIEDLQRNLQVVQQETRTDALTGVANRKKFDTTLRQEVRRVRDNAGSLCLILADIDHFKKINDAHGHPMGDQVLKFVASAIAGAVEQKDLVARYGGEEFVIILPNSSLRDGVKIAEKMRFTIGRRRLQKRKTGESIGTVTLSFGVALYKPTESMSDFFKRADDCLYLAKQRGRNKVISESQLESAAA